MLCLMMYNILNLKAILFRKEKKVEIVFIIFVLNLRFFMLPFICTYTHVYFTFSATLSVLLQIKGDLDFHVYVLVFFSHTATLQGMRNAIQSEMNESCDRKGFLMSSQIQQSMQGSYYDKCVL